MFRKRLTPPPAYRHRNPDREDAEEREREAKRLQLEERAKQANEAFLTAKAELVARVREKMRERLARFAEKGRGAGEDAEYAPEDIDDYTDIYMQALRRGENKPENAEWDEVMVLRVRAMHAEKERRVQRAELDAWRAQRQRNALVATITARARAGTLSAVKLSGIDLSGMNLSGIDLSGMNLSGSDLRGANLKRADLTGADLRDAYLDEANLNDANLEDANLEDANLEGANLTGANLTGADLTGANLTGANLEGANLEGANLTGANLKDTLLPGANLVSANLTGANLERAYLTHRNFQRANLRDANLKYAILTYANLRGANLRKANLTEADLEGANLEGANLEGATADEANFTGANLEGANLEGASTDEANFTGANLAGTALAPLFARAYGRQTGAVLKMGKPDAPARAAEFKKRYPAEFERLKADTQGRDFSEPLRAQVRKKYETPFTWLVTRGVYTDETQRLCPDPNLVYKFNLDLTDPAFTKRQRAFLTRLADISRRSGHPHERGSLFTVGWVRLCVNDAERTCLVEEVQSDVSIVRTKLKDGSAPEGLEGYEDVIRDLQPYLDRFYEDALGIVFMEAEKKGYGVEMLTYDTKQRDGSPRNVYTDLPRSMGMQKRPKSAVLGEAIAETWYYKPNPRRR